MVALPPVQHGVIAAAFRHEVGRAPYCHGPDVVGYEPWVNIVRGEGLDDAGDVTVLPGEGTTEEAHDVSCMHAIVKERC